MDAREAATMSNDDFVKRITYAARGDPEDVFGKITCGDIRALVDEVMERRSDEMADPSEAWERD